jgi:hypothetical protein
MAIGHLLMGDPLSDPGLNLLHILLQLLRGVGRELMHDLKVVRFASLFQNGLEDLTLNVVLKFFATVTPVSTTSKEMCTITVRNEIATKVK